LGLTQKQLALMTNISQSTIAKVESRKINPSYSVVKKIFEILESLEIETGVRAKEILSSKIIYVKKNDSIEKVVKLMERHGFSQLPVFDRNQSVGSVTEKTILELIANGKLSNFLKEPVKTVMEDSFPRIGEDTSLTVVSTLLKYSPAVLVTKNNKTVVDNGPSGKLSARRYWHRP